MTLLSLIEKTPTSASSWSVESGEGRLQWNEASIALEIPSGEGLELNASNIVSIQLSCAREVVSTGWLMRLLGSPESGVRWWVLVELRGREGRRMRFRALCSQVGVLEGLPEEQITGFQLGFDSLVSLLACARMMGASLVRVRLEALDATPVQVGSNRAAPVIEVARDVTSVGGRIRFRDRVLASLKHGISVPSGQPMSHHTREQLEARVARQSAVFPPLKLAQELEVMRRDVYWTLRKREVITEGARLNWTRRFRDLIADIHRQWLPGVEVSVLAQELSDPETCAARARPGEGVLASAWTPHPHLCWKPMTESELAPLLARALVELGYISLHERLRALPVPENPYAPKGEEELRLRAQARTLLYKVMALYPPLKVAMRLHAVIVALSELRERQEQLMKKSGEVKESASQGGAYILVAALERAFGALREGFDGLELPSRLLGLVASEERSDALIPVAEALEEAGASKLCDQLLEIYDAVGLLQHDRSALKSTISLKDRLAVWSDTREEQHVRKLDLELQAIEPDKQKAEAALLELSRSIRSQFPPLALYDGGLQALEAFDEMTAWLDSGKPTVHGQDTLIAILEGLMDVLAHYRVDDFDALLHAIGRARPEDVPSVDSLTLGSPPPSLRAVAALLAQSLPGTRFFELYAEQDPRAPIEPESGLWAHFYRLARHYAPLELAVQLAGVIRDVRAVQAKPAPFTPYLSGDFRARKALRAWNASVCDVWGQVPDAIRVLNAWSRLVVIPSTRYRENPPG